MGPDAMIFIFWMLSSLLPKWKWKWSHSVMSDSLRPHELQHTRLPCPSPTPRVHRVGDAIQPSHSLSSPSPPAFNLSQHWGLFKWVNSSHQVAKVMKFQLQHQSFQWIFRTDFLYDWLVWSLCRPKGLSRVFSRTIWKHQFFRAQPSLWSNSHIHTWPLGKPIASTRQTFVGKGMSLLLNMLSRLVITFLPRSKSLLISWLQSASAVIL